MRSRVSRSWTDATATAHPTASSRPPARRQGLPITGRAPDPGEDHESGGPGLNLEVTERELGTQRNRDQREQHEPSFGQVALRQKQRERAKGRR